MNSEHEIHEPTPHRTTVVQENAPRPMGLPSLSWGAVFAGLFVVLAIGWLLELLGVAIGVSIADVADSITMGGTLAPATSIWLLVCWLVSFFIGALVTARLAGRIDDTSGMLHGLTLWAVATVVTVALTYYGMSVLVNAGTQTLGVAAKGVGTTLSASATGAQNLATGTAQLTESITKRYGDRIQNTLYDRAAELVASSHSNLTEREVREALNDLDERTLRRIATDLTNDDSEGAAELLAETTELSREDSQAIVDSTYEALEERFGNPENDKSLAADLKTGLIENVDAYVASLDARGGPQVSEQNVQRALNRLDAQTAQDIAAHMAQGDFESAKRTLAQKTNLSQAQVDELVDGATEDINQQIAAYQEEFDAAVEATSTYTAQILWVVFAGAATALAAALAGGYLGADSSRRQYPSGNNNSRELITHA